MKFHSVLGSYFISKDGAARTSTHYNAARASGGILGFLPSVWSARCNITASPTRANTIFPFNVNRSLLLSYIDPDLIGAKRSRVTVRDYSFALERHQRSGSACSPDRQYAGSLQTITSVAAEVKHMRRLWLWMYDFTHGVMYVLIAHNRGNLQKHIQDSSQQGWFGGVRFFLGDCCPIRV